MCSGGTGRSLLPPSTCLSALCWELFCLLRQQPVCHLLPFHLFQCLLHSQSSGSLLPPAMAQPSCLMLGIGGNRVGCVWYDPCLGAEPGLFPRGAACERGWASPRHQNIIPCADQHWHGPELPKRGGNSPQCQHLCPWSCPGAAELCGCCGELRGNSGFRADSDLRA